MHCSTQQGAQAQPLASTQERGAAAMAQLSTKVLGLAFMQRAKERQGQKEAVAAAAKQVRAGPPCAQ